MEFKEKNKIKYAHFLVEPDIMYYICVMDPKTVQSEKRRHQLNLRRYLSNNTIASKYAYIYSRTFYREHLLSVNPIHEKPYTIDHIIPITFFDLSNDEEVTLAFIPFNLFPISEEENRLKGSYLDKPLIDAYFNKLLLLYPDNQDSVWINKLIEKLWSTDYTNTLLKFVNN